MAFSHAYSYIIENAPLCSCTDVASLAIAGLGIISLFTKGNLWYRHDPYHHVWFEKPQKNVATQAAAVTERNIAKKLDDSGNELVVFWGSQSGTAERLANSFARECRSRFGLKSMAADLSDYDPGTIAMIQQTKYVVFILSTFGEGDPSDNTTGFWNWIHNAENITLHNLRYLAFGLGNSNYKYYNRVVEMVVKALEKAGAWSLMPVGMANDAESTTEEDFLAWKEDVFKMFRTSLCLEEKEIKYEPTLSIVEDEFLDIIELYQGEPRPPHELTRTVNVNSAIKALTIKHSRELYMSPHRNCLHLDFDISDHSEMHYKTGDHLAIWPSNPDAEVDRLLRVLGLTDRRHIPISIRTNQTSVRVKVPTPTTPEALFRYYLEICSVVSRDTLLHLASLAPTQSARSFLLGIGADKDIYADFQTNNVVTLGRILEAAAGEESACWNGVLPSLLSFVIETVPHVRARYYSISSSSVVSPRSPSITAVISSENLRNNDNERIFGLTTNYLLALKQAFHSPNGLAQPHPHGLTYNLSGPCNSLLSGKVYAQVRKSNFKLPLLSSQPIIMVAAGTGIAPFRGFIAERARLMLVGKPIGRMILFFGCRRSEEDYLYKDEFEELQRTLGKGTLTIITAFSRETKEKVYVQDKFGEYAEQISSLLADRNANFYICGAASMAREVAKSIGTVMQMTRGWDNHTWKSWSEMAKRSKKWQEDVWG